MSWQAVPHDSEKQYLVLFENFFSKRKAFLFPKNQSYSPLLGGHLSRDFNIVSLAIVITLVKDFEDLDSVF